MTREATLEGRCVRWASAQGCLALKLWPTRAGLPDRLLLLPGGRVWFVEFKIASGRLSPIQGRVIEQLRALGFRADVVRDFDSFKAQVDFWM